LSPPSIVARIQLLDGHAAGDTVPVVMADSGAKYLSTDLRPDLESDR